MRNVILVWLLPELAAAAAVVVAVREGEGVVGTCWEHSGSLWPQMAPHLPPFVGPSSAQKTTGEKWTSYQLAPTPHTDPAHQPHPLTCGWPNSP